MTGEEDWFAAHYKKQVPFALDGVTLRLSVAHDLFSSHAVDTGSRMLLRTLVREGVRAGRALDLGCGYGPIGLAARALRIAGHADLCDRDALATLFAQRNALDNDIDNVDVMGSLGYDDLDGRRYDLIVSNIPGKAGDRAIAHLLLDARQRLTAEGAVAIVVVAPLAPRVSALLAGDATVRVLFRQDGRAYSVVHYGFRDAPQTDERARGFDSGAYDARDIRLEIAGRTLSLTTAQGLDEEAGPGVTSAHALTVLPSLTVGERCFVLNPGQGYAAVAMALAAPARLALIDRDLLALRTSARNVRRAGFAGTLELVHRVGMAVNAQPFDSGVMFVREAEGAVAAARTLEAAASAIRPGGQLLVAGTSTALARLERRAYATGVRPAAGRRRRGVAAVVFERQPQAGR